MKDHGCIYGFNHNLLTFPHHRAFEIRQSFKTKGWSMDARYWVGKMENTPMKIVRES